LPGGPGGGDNRFMTRTLFVSLFVCLGLLQADQVLLKNGDRITGSIVKKDGNNLVFKGTYTGVVTLPWDQVESIKSDAPVNVVLKDRTVKSKVESSAGSVRLTDPGTSVAPADVVAIRNADEQAAYERLLSPGWGQLWTGTASLGYAGTAGNAQTTTFTTAVGAARVTKTDKTTLYFNAIKASASVNRVKADTAEAVRGGWAYSHNLSSRTFINAFNDYEYDRFQSLDLRFVIGGGFGYIAWKAERGRLDLLGGMAYERSKFSPVNAREFSRNAASAYWGDDYNYKLSTTTTLVQSFRMFNNLSDTGQYRINFDLNANTRLKKWLTWTVGVSDRYLSNHVVGRKSNDFLYTTGLGINFAR
jgi:hypothetical protein